MKPAQTPTHTPKKPYTPPKLQRHHYTIITGASLPVVTNGLPNPFNQDNSNH